MGLWPECTLCGEEVDTENPSLSGGVYAVSPTTHRKGWMHGWCYRDAVEALKGVPSKDPIYQDQYDEYLMKWGS